ncbi:iron uptake porin [Oscillatoria sp. FACHB-1407]|uniref:iron uptake porin n=1 Tax=Oscillatoria sp. FACHB-1407 TaxID=2692847 RepID=UPI001F54C37D|nr:iron uptake porin [Oscillatoria sp. FACHB-1407]
MSLGQLGLTPVLGVIGVLLSATIATADSSTPAPPEEVDLSIVGSSVTDNQSPLLSPQPWEPDTIAQSPSVAQLSDVQPTDWAYEALRSLVERYGCVSGYADGTYRGGRSLTRYEFAAALNTCLDRVNELVNESLAEPSLAEDLTTLRRLQEDFAEELATVRSRMEDLENRTAELESNQFSTTTRLSGQTILAFNGGLQGGVDDPSLVLLSRVRLNLVTSFAGTDQLLTQLETGTGGANNDAAAYLLRDEGEFRDDLVEAGNELTDQALNQRGSSLNDFPQLRLNNQNSIEGIRDTLATNLRDIALAAGVSPLEAQEIFETAVEAVETAQGISGFLQTNSALEYSDADSQVRLNRLSYDFAPNPNLTFAVFAQGYASDYVDRNRYANDSGDNFSTYGFVNNQLLLANDPPGAGAALRWNPLDFLTLRAVYRAEQAAIATVTPNDGNQRGLFGDPYLGVVELEFAILDDLAIALQYSGGAQGDVAYDAVGANLQLTLGQLGVFGRFGYAYNFPGGIEPSAWSLGVTMSDLFIPGAVGGFAIGQPLVFEEDVINFFNSTQTNYELFYKLPINDNISVTPMLQLITDPGNRGDDAIFTGTLRTVFNF